MCYNKTAEVGMRRVILKSSSRASKFLRERDYVTFGYLLSQIRPSSGCLSSVMFVHPNQRIEIFRNFYAISYPSHQLTNLQNFTEIVPGEPLRRELNARGVAKLNITMLDISKAISWKRCKIHLRV